MIELNGKYNVAKVFTDNIDSETMSQIIQLLNQPFTADAQIRIMPDTHAGKGCTIGTTMTLTDKVVPNLVGVDIGCGMLAIKLEEKEIDLEKLDQVINEKVPAGFSIHEHAVTKFDELKNILCEIDIDNANRSIGSLGGGNHFIEVNKDADKNLWLVIHTGSRHLGIEVCGHYQRLGIKELRENEIKTKINNAIAKLKAEGKERDIENTIKIIKMQHQSIPDDLCYVEGENFKNYIHDMTITQKYAKLNRETIGNIITCFISCTN
jgi:RNA-splicing ligase RtcB